MNQRMYCDVAQVWNFTWDICTVVVFAEACTSPSTILDMSTTSSAISQNLLSRLVLFVNFLFVPYSCFFFQIIQMLIAR